MESIRRQAGMFQSSSAEAAIEAAQRAGVTVYAIYHPSADYLTSDFSKLYAGQIQLAHVAVKPAARPISWALARCLPWRRSWPI